MKNQSPATQFAVLGLGRFGLSVVRTLAESDVHILACDRNEALLHEAAEYATRVVKMDVADEDGLAKLGLGNFDVVVIAMGDDFEASVIATMKLKELGTGLVVVKALGQRQKRIFESLGADVVVMPEIETGVKIARRLMRNNVLNALEESGQLDVTEMHPLPEWVGKSVRQSDIRNKHGISLLAVVRGGNALIPVSADEVLLQDDLLVVLCGACGADK